MCHSFGVSRLDFRPFVPREHYRRFSRDVIAAMLVHENKRSLISYVISLLLLVSLEVG